MAATAFTLYNASKLKMLNGGLDLDADTVRAYLYKSTSNASTTAIILVGSLTNAVAAGGYTGAKALSGRAITASGDAAKFDATDPIFTASGANVGSACFLVIAASNTGGNHAVCWSKLSTAAFNVTSGNTLTIQFSSSGIFSLT